MSSTIYLNEHENRFYIFYDHQINKKWCFVDIEKGKFKTFENREDSIKYLGFYGRFHNYKWDSKSEEWYK